MSRYKKVTHNEVTLKEIGGVTPILRPNRDERMDLIQQFMKNAKAQEVDLQGVRNVLTNLLYNSLFLWKDNQRTTELEAGSENITKDDIDAYVVDHIFELWTEVLLALDIIDREKAKKLEEQQKKKLDEEINSPN